jgi:hypothetical protein
MRIRFITVVTRMVGRETFRFPEACLAVEALISQRGRAAMTPEQLTEK